MLVGYIACRKIAKCFISGLKPDVFHEEMYFRTFGSHGRVTYRDIIEISDRIKKLEPRQDFSKDRKGIPTAVSNFEKRGECNFQVGAYPGVFKKLGSRTKG